MLTLIYKTYVRLATEYGIELLVTDFDYKKIVDIVQNHALRTIIDGEPKTRYRSLKLERTSPA